MSVSIVLLLLSILLINCSADGKESDKLFNICVDSHQPAEASNNQPPETTSHQPLEVASRRKRDTDELPPFRCPFESHNRLAYNGGCVRLVSEAELPIATTLAGLQVRLDKGGIVQMHWHVGSEWAYMIYGNARITAVSAHGRAFVQDVKAGDLWLFPGGIPHSVQGTGPDGAFFLSVHVNGSFNPLSGTFELSDLINNTPLDVLAKDFQANESTFADISPKRPLIFMGELPRSLEAERLEVAEGTVYSSKSLAFFPDKIVSNVNKSGGMVKIVDATNFHVTDIAAAIVTLKPGGLREIHWHPNADEWQYYVTGMARMTVFATGSRARTMDFQEGDVGYVQKSFAHYIENTGDKDLVFLEIFHTRLYKDISLAQWLAHTPSRLVNEHIRTGENFIKSINKLKAVVQP